MCNVYLYEEKKKKEMLTTKWLLCKIRDGRSQVASTGRCGVSARAHWSSLGLVLPSTPSSAASSSATLTGSPLSTCQTTWFRSGLKCWKKRRKNLYTYTCTTKKSINLLLRWLFKEYIIIYVYLYVDSAIHFQNYNLIVEQL